MSGEVTSTSVWAKRSIDACICPCSGWGCCPWGLGWVGGVVSLGAAMSSNPVGWTDWRPMALAELALWCFLCASLLNKASQKPQGIRNIPSQRVADLEAAIHQLHKNRCILDSCTIFASYEVTQAQKAELLLDHTAKRASTSSEEFNAQIPPRSDDQDVYEKVTKYLIIIQIAWFHFTFDLHMCSKLSLFQIKIISHIINISMMFLIFTKNGPTKQKQFQTCYLCQSSRDILSESSVNYTEINQCFFKNSGPSTFLFGHVAKGCHRLHESHLLPLSLTYLQVLEEWNFLVSNFTLSFWILGPAFDLYRLFILKNIHMHMNSTHMVAKSM